MGRAVPVKTRTAPTGGAARSTPPRRHRAGWRPQVHMNPPGRQRISLSLGEPVRTAKQTVCSELPEQRRPSVGQRVIRRRLPAEPGRHIPGVARRVRADRSPVSHADTRNCSRSPSSPTAGSSARTRCTSSPASTAGPVPDAADETRAGRCSRSPGMAWMVAPGTGIDRVIQRVITRFMSGLCGLAIGPVHRPGGYWHGGHCLGQGVEDPDPLVSAEVSQQRPHPVVLEAPLCRTRQTACTGLAGKSTTGLPGADRAVGLGSRYEADSVRAPARQGPSPLRIIQRVALPRSVSWTRRRR